MRQDLEIKTYRLWRYC